MDSRPRRLKFLLANFHYFRYGGPDTYLFNIASALERLGHTVIPFSFDYDETLPTPYRSYFPTPITGRGPSLLRDQSLSVAAKVRAVGRMFHNPTVDAQFRRLMHSERPDVVYSIHLSSTMLPNILRIAKREFRVPVLYRLSDFHMFCPSNLFYCQGAICHDCESATFAAVRKRCVQNSAVASLLRVLQLKYFWSRGWYDAVDAFLCPSALMHRYMVARGVSLGRLRHLPTFSPDLGPVDEDPGTGILFAGRVVQEKGVEVLLRAFNSIRPAPCRLVIAGSVSEAYRRHLFQLLDDEQRKHVSIEGPLSRTEVVDRIKNCRIAVHPAIWYENMPNSILEAMSAGKPIIASSIGSLPELVHDGKNGVLVQPGSTTELRDAITQLLSDDRRARSMGAESRRMFLEGYTAEHHLAALLTLADDILETRGR